ncbi:16S rRNA (guanine1207-N2)-methyltransferase [Paraoerskovia marina]|uniref:16S rRNA (Guanine1207-N2)-methyltransferase n=1 Tax=Paraoerskovia marina TaxID=545619 RepID=A0A1H1QL18_9CELL|nr:class I SAM-dependent methyltransferase [Paraoerskovia marina]SDS24027.1 16S rRNA (guanine1207-N2)-methyltransferase [Paraoerskovia marina]
MTPDDVLAAIRTHPSDPTDRVAVDATDRLLLDEAAPLLAGLGEGEVAVVDDRSGALTLSLALGYDVAGVRVIQDLASAEATLAFNAVELDAATSYTSHQLTPDAFAGVKLVLWQLPRSVAATREVAEAVASSAHPDVTVLAGGRVKHMTRTMNEVLAESFDDVHATLGRQKSRALVARGPHGERTTSTYPVRAHVEVPGPGTSRQLEVAAHGAVFNGTDLDHGTRLLLSTVILGDAVDVVDLGCGSGIVGTTVALAAPEAQVVATDDSDAAVRSAGATARANGVRARVRLLRDDAAASLPDGSADLVLLNPPFHAGASVDTGIAKRLIEQAARILRPGGTLWCVWNSHLEYKGTLERVVGSTRQAARDKKFTVTVSRRR